MLMKKRIIIAVGAVLLAASAAVAISTGRTGTAEQMLFEANVEVLMRDESESVVGCISGGPGSTECSIGAGIEIVGVGVTFECSVACSGNYYACCGLGCYCEEV